MTRNASTETVETAATEAKKNRQVNATISAELFDVLDNYRWEARIDRMPKLVAVALQEYAENHKLVKPADASAE